MQLPTQRLAMDPAVHATPHPFPLRANAPLAKATSVKNTSLCALITLQGCEVVLWLLPMHPRAIRVLHTSSPWTAQFRRSHGQEAVLESARRLSRSPYGSVWEGEVTRATGRAPPCRDPLPFLTKLGSLGLMAFTPQDFLTPAR